MYNVGKKKRPKGKGPDPKAKKETLFEIVAKRAESVPPPWKYDTAIKWSSNTKDIPNRGAQVAKYQWQGVAKDDMQIEKPVRNMQKKIDMSLKKYTYIDWIVMANTKESYPKPGPNNYFMDLKTAKKYYKEDLDLFTKKEKDGMQKNNLP